MKLWKVTNGYIGYDATHVLVIADGMWDALNAARRAFKANNDARVAWLGEKAGYEASYWTNLEAAVLCDDVSQPWVSEVA